MAKEIGPTCRTCPFADEFNDPWGLCRAEPPTLVETRDEDGTVSYMGEWPQINADIDWCGKHPERAKRGSVIG